MTFNLGQEWGPEETSVQRRTKFSGSTTVDYWMTNAYYSGKKLTFDSFKLAQNASENETKSD